MMSFTDSPIVTFTILLLVTLTVPPIFERLRLPGLVGLLFAGVILGDDVLGWLDPESETIKLLSDIGKIYLMFVAGLEIDLQEFRKTKNRSLGFGAATFILPLSVGTLIGTFFGFNLNAAVVMGSLLASHTLLGYPIVNRLGVKNNEAVTVTIGATIFTDIAALLVLAICVSIAAGEFTGLDLLLRLASLGLYAALVLVGFDWAGKKYFQRTGDEESNQFLFVLLAVFIASVGAQLIDIDRIVGAFLAGLAVNDVVGHSPVEEKVEFVGSALFIPFFFVGMGLLLDLPVFINTLRTELALTGAIVGGLLAAKFLAAFFAKLAYSYTWPEALTMWSLSLPQVAATLAAALVGLQQGLLTQEVFNSVIVLMLVTSLLGPLLTERFASRIPIEKTSVSREPWWETLEQDLHKSTPDDPQSFNVVVPVYNPLTERYLIEMAALLAAHENGRVVPVTIAPAHVHMDEPQLNIAMRQGRQLLARAASFCEEFEVSATPQLRIDDDIASGISRTAREQQASLIVMGWGETTTLRARLFGSTIDGVIWSSHCPVVVTRLLDEPVDLNRILVPVKNLSPQAVRAMRFAQLFADTHRSTVTYLHVGDRRTPPEQVKEFEAQIQEVLEATGLQGEYEIKSIAHDRVAETIIKAARSFDLIVLRSLRRRTAGGLAVSDVTTQVVKELTCSVVLFGEPHS